MKIVTLSEIKEALDFDGAVAAIKAAFIAHSAGQVKTPPVGHLGFDNPPGDMHLKYGHIAGDDVFVVKLATGFYDNPKIGLPSSNGLMMVISARTGAPLALLQDEGYLTDIRTAIAGSLASSSLLPTAPLRVGIVGTGIQACLQLECLSKVATIDSVCVWGRTLEATSRYVEKMQKAGISVTVAVSPKELCTESNVIITTTPATAPILKAQWVQPGTHITAVGADAPGKQELDAAIIEGAALTVCDSKEQCLHHGEMSHAQQHLITEHNSMELGTLLASLDTYARPTDAITVADLTGIAAQDIAIAQHVWERLNA